MPSISIKDFSKHPRTQNIYDIFTFFNELDLLEIRLNILAPFVDHFVIVESSETFSGRLKKLWFKENEERFKRFRDKIVHYVVRDTPRDVEELRHRGEQPDLSMLDREIINNTLTSDNIKPGVTHWLKEFYQKESIKKALVGLKDDDICFVSDVDEIWNPEARLDFSADGVFKLRQLVYAYHLNNRSDEPWAGTLVTKFRNIKNECLNHLRTAPKTRYTYVENGGWHFTNQGGADFIREKLEASYSRDDFNTASIKAGLKNRIEKNEDYIGRTFHFRIDESDLPAYLIEHRDQYMARFKNNNGRNQTSHPAIIVKLQGGLGNQLFQYALGRALEITKQTPVRYDLTWYAQQTMRKVEIDGFDIRLTPATDLDLRFAQSQQRPGRLGKLPGKLRNRGWKYYLERGLPYHPEVVAVQAPAYLDGYWQSEKYFTNVASTIRKEFQLRQPAEGKNAAMLGKIAQQEAVAIHFRRGDYVKNSQTNQTHGMPTVEHYLRAAAYVLERYPNSVFYVFSDDLAWVRDNLHLDATMAFVDQNGPDKGYEDLRIMSACRHHIIANSTFSWWGAWLAERPGQIVIAPKRWFASPSMDARDVVPDRWVRL